MLVRSKEMVFRNGRRYRVDPASGLTAAFEIQLAEGKKLSKHLVPAEGAEKVEKVVKSATPPGQAEASVKTGVPTKKELMAQLAAAGVKFKATLSNEALQALLDAHKKQAAPAASTAASKEETKTEPEAKAGEAKGSGDQDVI
jgi:hypothetical protein